MFARKKKPRLWAAVPFILLPVYLFFFPYPLGREAIVRPVWTLDPGKVPEAAGGTGEPRVFPFRAGNRFGYATSDGRLVYSDVVRYQVALSERGFINYGSRPDYVVFMDPQGGFQYGIQIFGYPVLDSSGEALYSIDTDLAGIKRLSFDGEVLWQAQFSSPMTSADVQADRVLIGLLDGRAMLFDAEGAIAFDIDPPGSRLPVILGTALASPGELALVSGIDPQNLVLARGEGYENIRSVSLGSDFRREMLLRFGPSGRFLYLEQEGAIVTIEPARDRRARLGIPGRLTTFAAGPEFAVAAAAGEGTVQLVVFRPMATRLAGAVLAAPAGWSMVSGNSLFVGLENRLLRADVVEE
jgi:hypothetical protein